MSAVSIAIQALLANSGVTDLVKKRINPNVAPQGGDMPDIVVSLIFDNDDLLLSGAARYPEARVSIACRGTTFKSVDAVGDAVVTALRDLRGTFAGRSATFFKEGTDVTDFSDDFSTQRRILDYRIRYR